MSEKVVPFPGLGASGSYAGTAWDDSDKTKWDAYLARYPDLMKEAQGVVAAGMFPDIEAYASWHYAHNGQAEHRVAFDQVTAPSDLTNTSGYTVTDVTVTPSSASSNSLTPSISLDWFSIWSNYKLYIIGAAALFAVYALFLRKK